MPRTPRRRSTTPRGTGTPSATVADERPARRDVPGAAAHAPARPLPRRRRNPFGFLRRLQPRGVADVISELRKVTWPSHSETQYLTIVVAIVAIAVGIVLGLFDLAFGWIIDQLFFN
jgi:preprotein translocase SecE subunit